MDVYVKATELAIAAMDVAVKFWTVEGTIQELEDTIYKLRHRLRVEGVHPGEVGALLEALTIALANLQSARARRDQLASELAQLDQEFSTLTDMSVQIRTEVAGRQYTHRLGKK